MDRQWRYKSRVKSFRSNYPRYFHQQNPLSITFHSTPPLRGGGGGGAFKGGGSTPRPRKLSPFRFIFELTPIKRRSRIVWFRRLERAFIKEKQLRLTKVSGASPARRKREVEDKKGKARSVLEVAREIERKRREPEATRGAEQWNEASSWWLQPWAPWCMRALVGSLQRDQVRLHSLTFSASTLQTTVKRQLFSFAFFNREWRTDREDVLTRFMNP